MTTWEETEDLHRRFPTHPAWGQAGFQGGGNVRTYRRARRQTKAQRRRLAPDGNPTAASRAIPAIYSSLSGIVTAGFARRLLLLLRSWQCWRGRGVGVRGDQTLEDADNEVRVGGVDAEGEEQRRRHHRCVPEEPCVSGSGLGLLDRDP
ncbi:unnamed protein product [Miscanthus lutarioriparius]|uniref:Uncharacterized protein n=1 Tax=Miscanthus lutarioriparius TaxID=422564 RepID=A0A811S776_9POAL|nr:unnamed protein product [Miscanthus lutarioriparius]